MRRRINAWSVVALAAFCLPLTAQAPAEELKLGKLITRSLQTNETHSYTVAATADSLVRVDLDEEAQLRLKVFEPKGQLLAEFAMPRDYYGAFPLYFTGRDAGTYRIEVGVSAGAAGSYNLELHEQRQIGPDDSDLLAAQTAYFHAWQIRAQPDRKGAEEALAEFPKSAVLFQTAKNTRGEAACLTGIGPTPTFLCQNDKAVATLNQAVDLWHKLNNPKGEALALTRLGWAENQLGKVEPALAHLKSAVELAKDAGTRKVYAEALTAFATVFGIQGNTHEAIGHLNEALGVQRQLGDRVGEISALNNLAAFYSLDGEVRKAIEAYDQLLAGARQSRNHQMEGTVLINLGHNHELLSEYQVALNNYKQALSIFRLLGDQRISGLALSSMGAIYEVLNDTQRALDCYQEALPLRRVSGDTRGEGITLNNLGFLLFRLKEYDQALSNLQRAVALMKSSGEVRTQSNAFNNIGDVQRALGQREKALESYAEALRLRTALNDRQGQGYTHMSLATAYEEWGDHEQAAQHFKGALSLSRAIEDLRTEIFSLYGLSKMAIERGELADARAGIESAIHLMESLRFKLVDPALRTTYFTSASDLYELQIDILLQLHRRDPTAKLSEAAFEASERARARNLLDTLAEARVNFRQGADPAVLQKESSFREKIAAKADQQLRLLNGKHTDTQAEAVRRELELLVNDLYDVETEIRKASPRYGALTQPHIATVAEVQSKLLDSDTVLLEYALGEHRSYLWAISKDSAASYELPGRGVVETATKRLYGAASVRQGISGAAESSRQILSRADETTAAARALSHMLLEPVAELIRGKRLLVVADGSLRYVPFGLLSRPGATAVSAYTPLIVGREIVNLSSASSLLAIRDAPANRRSASKLVAVFADPVFDKNDARVTKSGSTKAPESGQRNPEVASPETPEPTNLERSVSGLDLSRDGFTLPRLPFTRREADAIFAATPRGKGLEALDFQASIQTLENPAIRDYKVVHFATHGLLNTSQPELSGLVLSLVDQAGNPQRGFLELADIYNLNLSADLIVLSACQTGLGKEVKGEGLVGLTRGFLYAGAKGVVASLWKVDDAATAALMEDFYKGMFSGRLSPAAALRQAEIKTWKQRRWASPYFWGGFVYEGDWR